MCQELDGSADDLIATTQNSEASLPFGRPRCEEVDQGGTQDLRGPDRVAVENRATLSIAMTGLL